MQETERSEADGGVAHSNPQPNRAKREIAEGPAPERPPSTSLFRYSPGLLLISVAIADAIRLPDPDLWGNVRFGQDFLSQHRLVVLDTYSYTETGHPWTGHEWLAEVLLAAAFNHVGVFGLILLKLACTTVVILALAAALAETDSSTLVQFAVLIGAAVVIKPQLQFRPQSFEFALLAVLICLLTRDAYRRTGRLWLAIPIGESARRILHRHRRDWHLQRRIGIARCHGRARLRPSDKTRGNHGRCDPRDAGDAVRIRDVADRRARVAQSIHARRDRGMAAARIRGARTLATAQASNLEL